jgi:hypothetical protein
MYRNTNDEDLRLQYPEAHAILACAREKGLANVPINVKLPPMPEDVTIAVLVELMLMFPDAPNRVFSMISKRWQGYTKEAKQIANAILGRRRRA